MTDEQTALTDLADGAADPASASVPPTTRHPWRQGEVVELSIDDLSSSGDGVGRYAERAVFVPDAVVGDRLLVRLVHTKPQYAHGKLVEILAPSPHRIRPRCIVADKCGGCQWQHVDYAFQLETKRNLIVQSLERLGGFSDVQVAPVLGSEAADERRQARRVFEATAAAQALEVGEAEDAIAPSILASSISAPSIIAPPIIPLRPASIAPDADLNYRNKATYPLTRSSSGQVQAGYYQKGSHHLINLNQCPIQDQRLNPLLADVKQDLLERGWSIYDEKLHRGKLRHLGLRIGRRTGEMLLTLVSKESNLAGLEAQAIDWISRYPDLVGVALNLNSDRTNAIFGSDTLCIAGRPYLREIFAGLEFHIQPTTFFQVNTEQAEALLQVMIDQLDLQGHEVLVDAYCGIGTLTLPLAARVRQAIGIEMQPESIQQADANAALNHITNATFQSGTVEDLLPQLPTPPDIVLLDPPRKGCDASVLQTLLTLKPAQIAYLSCNPATLARDLKHLCTDGAYRLTRVQPADFFPQTPHVECVAFLERAAL